MNIASARNCVSTSHFAAATCHYCTITVCLLSLCRAQASPVWRPLSIVLKFLQREKKLYISSFTKTRWKIDRVDDYTGLYIMWDKNCFLVSPVNFARSILSRASLNFQKTRILCAHQHFYIWILLYSLTTDWTLSVLCVDGHAWRSLYPVWYVSTFILLIILHY